MNPLSTPTLHQVRTHKIGKFLDKIGRIYFDGKWASQNLIKSVTHPKWFDSLKTTNQMTLYIGINAHDLLMAQKNLVSRRWPKGGKNGPKWDSELGVWRVFRRTPKNVSGSYIPVNEIPPEDKKKGGRPPMGKAYRFRRAVWRTLSSERLVLRQLRTTKLVEIERGKRIPVSIRLPILSLAIKEVIQKEMIELIDHNDVWMIEEWLTLKEMRKESLLEASEIFHMNNIERNNFIKTLTEKHWKALIARWIELHIFHKYWKDDAGKGIKLAPPID